MTCGQHEGATRSCATCRQCEGATCGQCEGATRRQYEDVTHGQCEGATHGQCKGECASWQYEGATRLGFTAAQLWCSLFRDYAMFPDLQVRRFGPVRTGSPFLGPLPNQEPDFRSGSAHIPNLGPDPGPVHQGSGPN